MNNDINNNNINNEYLYSQNNFKRSSVLIVLAILIILLVDSIVLLFYNRKYSSYNLKEYTNLELMNTYTENTNSVRRFQNDNHMLILLPKTNNMKKNIYLYLTIENDEITDSKYGTYSINNHVVETDFVNFLEDESGLNNDGEILIVNDDGIKAYKYESKKNDQVLIIDGTRNNSFSIYVNLNKNNFDLELLDYEETDKNIKLSNELEFEKKGSNLTLNGNKYNLIS